MSLYNLLRPLLFYLDAETSHDLAIKMLSIGSRSKLICSTVESVSARRIPSISVSAMGLEFPNPVGLAAGLDKQGSAANLFHSMGFGFVELGTVTPLPQPGNPKPRLFRLAEHHAIINRMGFNSIGLSAFLDNVSKTRPGIICGINIGKNAATPMDQAISDYLTGLKAVYDSADYIAINISSPNTKNLREMQNDDMLDALLSALHSQRLELSESSGTRKPLVIKIAPDLDPSQIDSIANLARRHHMDGIAATNTTLQRQGVSSHNHSTQAGGLSGLPLQQLSSEIIQNLYKNLQDEIPIIGLGGIQDAASALEKFECGASLVQIYTGLIYHGPSLIGEILNAKARL